jgi:hypothetical protein
VVDSPALRFGDILNWLWFIFMSGRRHENQYGSIRKMFEKPTEKTAEQSRLREAPDAATPWKLWGPYLSERQWGTVREDYSDNGDAEKCDGVRCDMAMLLLPDVFERTWGLSRSRFGQRQRR